MLIRPRTIRLLSFVSILALHSLLLPRHACAEDLGNESDLMRTLKAGSRNLSQAVAGEGEAMPEDRVSVVMMNWKRPKNVMRILKKYIHYANVGEVIIWMCNPETSFKFNHPKVRIINDVSSNDKFGVATRFKGCLEAKFPWVLIQDDDHYATEMGLQKLIIVKSSYPTRLIGAFGRDWSPTWNPYYSKEPRPAGPRPIVLTSLILTDKATCASFWQYTPRVEEYIRANSHPLWNGEDIFFSLVSYKTTGQLPLVVGVKKVFLPQRNTGIHFGDEHDIYRDKFLKYAITQLELNYSSEAFGWKSGQHKPFLRYGADGRILGLNTERGKSSSSASAGQDMRRALLAGEPSSTVEAVPLSSTGAVQGPRSADRSSTWAQYNIDMRYSSRSLLAAEPDQQQQEAGGKLRPGKMRATAAGVAQPGALKHKWGQRDGFNKPSTARVLVPDAGSAAAAGGKLRSELLHATATTAAQPGALKRKWGQRDGFNKLSTALVLVPDAGLAAAAASNTQRGSGSSSSSGSRSRSSRKRASNGAAREGSQAFVRPSFKRMSSSPSSSLLVESVNLEKAAGRKYGARMRAGKAPLH